MRYGSSYNVAGEYSGNLDNDGEDVTLKLPLPFQAAMLRFEFNDSWHPATDGGGFALEIRDTVLLENGAEPAAWNEAQSWQAGAVEGGTPGTADGLPLSTVVINEVLTHTDLPQQDAIELYNTTGDLVELSGWYLSDARSNYQRFRIPDGTTIPPGGYVVFDEDDFNPTPGDPGPNDFALNGAHGDDVWLLAADAEGNPTRFVDHVAFGAAPGGESFGRWPNGSGPLYPMIGPTLDKARPEEGLNSGPRVGPVIISEVHYNPGPLQNDDDLEFIEIYNTIPATVELANWRIRKGIDFDFPAGATLDGHSALVIVPFDLGDADKLAAFRAAYNLDTAVELVGGYTGRLSDGGEKVQLQRPDDPPVDEPGFIPRLLEDEVIFDNEAPWATDANGGGDSLHRAEIDAWGNTHLSFNDLPPTPGSTLFVVPQPDARVVGRYIFYNSSAFDGGLPEANVQDDDAIAPDKEALRPGQTATFANYTSYDRGINGIMIDVDRIARGVTLEADDFRFRVGNDNDPTGWLPAAALPSITVRPGEGLDGSDRITLIWEDNVLGRQWLQVTVLATADTWLAEDDVFYFGNAIGETGNSAGPFPEQYAKVNAFDMLGARDNQRNFLNPAPIELNFDFNRDALVDAADMLIARNHQTHFLSALRLITAPAAAEGIGDWGLGTRSAAGNQSLISSPQPPDKAADEVGREEILPGKLDWLYEFAPAHNQHRHFQQGKPDRQAVDRAMLDYGR